MRRPFPISLSDCVDVLRVLRLPVPRVGRGVGEGGLPTGSLRLHAPEAMPKESHRGLRILCLCVGAVPRAAEQGPGDQVALVAATGGE